ncbi:hypothetical protein DFH27DRAFT_608393 [Peziza echinospora]|nr:hypothetical protein DFH27DRAFT_608393 [Peziza echinospora]
MPSEHERTGQAPASGLRAPPPRAGPPRMRTTAASAPENLEIPLSDNRTPLTPNDPHHPPQKFQRSPYRLKLSPPTAQPWPAAVGRDARTPCPPTLPTKEKCRPPPAIAITIPSAAHNHHTHPPSRPPHRRQHHRRDRASPQHLWRPVIASLKYTHTPNPPPPPPPLFPPPTTQTTTTPQPQPHVCSERTLPLHHHIANPPIGPPHILLAHQQ